MGKISEFFNKGEGFHSSGFMCALAFITVAIVLTSILSSRYYLYQDIIENGVSKKQIIAKKNIEVVDTQKTELIKREVSNKIRPVVTPVEDNYLKTSLQDLYDNIKRVRAQNAKYDSKFKELCVYLEVQDNKKEEAIVSYFLNASSENLAATFGNAKFILDELLSTGINETDIDLLASDNYITGKLGDKTRKSQIKPIAGILEHVIMPNLIVDEYATEIARKNAVNAVKPYVVTFKKGDKILSVGEQLTQVKREALKKSGYNTFELNKGGILGVFLLTCLTMLFLIVYMKKYERKFFTPQYLGIIGAFSIILTYICVLITPMDAIQNYYMPYPAFTIIIAVFTNPIVAFLSTILILALLSLTLFIDPQVSTVFVFASIMAAYSVSKINYSKRFDIIKCGLEVGIVTFLTIMLVAMFEEQFEIFTNLSFISSATAGFLNGLFSSIIALGVLPIIENVFKIVTPYGLIELADHNQELLSKLQYKAPGTYHHSLMVANLCEAAAEAIGANPILARVGAFYHDIGKLKRPLFFIENQSYFGIENPHTKLNPRLSKMVITSHTKDGVELAKEYGLPQVIIDFIQQHHGEGLAGHFYKQAVDIEGKENVQEEQFRYPGPKPLMKETAILMLADAVESAVRSLKNPSQEQIENMINKIITERLNDGQLSDSPLTLKDIKLIANTFNRILRGMQHDRIKYQENILSEFEDRNKIKIQPSKEEKLEKRIQEKITQKKQEQEQKSENSEKDEQ